MNPPKPNPNPEILNLAFERLIEISPQQAYDAERIVAVASYLADGSCVIISINPDSNVADIAWTDSTVDLSKIAK